MYTKLPAIEKGNFRVELLKHSITERGHEALTFLCTYERFIHAEVMTHRWSRNASSSRAIPFDKMMKWIDRDPAMPLHLGANRAGMQAGAEVESPKTVKAFLLGLYHEVKKASQQLYQGHDLHKEIVNRYTEPWGWITSVMTMGGGQLCNFFNLRIHRMAHPNIQRLAVNMARLTRDSTPQMLSKGDWHMPFHEGPPPKGRVEDVAVPLVWDVARSAWTSYNNPTKDADYEKALKRYKDCIEYKHVTPCEHQLLCNGRYTRGVVPGYVSYRSLIPGECDTHFEFSKLDEWDGVDYLPAL